MVLSATCSSILLSALTQQQQSSNRPAVEVQTRGRRLYQTVIQANHSERAPNGEWKESLAAQLCNQPLGDVVVESIRSVVATSMQERVFCTAPRLMHCCCAADRIWSKRIVCFVVAARIRTTYCTVSVWDRRRDTHTPKKRQIWISRRERCSNVGVVTWKLGWV